MHRFASVSLSLSLVASLGCDAEEPTPDAQTFVDGVARDTEGGAFRVTLDSRDDRLDVGDNFLVAHVGFHRPDDALDPGIGIPDARVRVEAWMPLDEGEVMVEASELGGGRYAIDSLLLDQPGIWQVDLHIDVGETMRENASFVFVVE